MRDPDSVARAKLAGRILWQTRFRDRQPILLSEIAQLRFFAESDAEREMPPDELARLILARESKRMGYPPPVAAIWKARIN